MSKQVLISVGEKDCRLAVLEDGQLAEFSVDNRDEGSLVGNIYKARVEGVVSGLQAAFVDIGGGKNAFLHFSDVLFEALPSFAGGPSAPDSATSADSEEGEKAGAAHGRPAKGQKGQKGRRQRRLPPHTGRLPRSIEQALAVGQELLVQVTKEPIGTKGPRVSTALSLPGRYLVLLPFPNQTGGISKKIEDPKERRRLRDILKKIDKPLHAHIVRTAGVGRSAEEILADVDFLEKQWKALMRVQAKAKTPSLIHDDHDFLYRLVRDIFTEDIDEIWVDATPERNAMRRHLKAMIPELVGRVKPYGDRLRPLFDHFDVERQIGRALRRKVWLKSGGYLIFDEMEAMTAVDVNSGKYTGKGDQAKTILKTNVEAAHMVARQLRLRDIGGLIVVDFIDMDKEENRRSIQGEFQAALRRDRARISTTSISEFGLVEMTRQRVRRSLRRQLFHECPHCQGEGLLLNEYEVWRNLKRAILSHLIGAPRPDLEVACHPSLIRYIGRETAATLNRLETLYRIKINLVPHEEMDAETFEVKEIFKPGAKKRRIAPPAVKADTEERAPEEPESEAAEEEPEEAGSEAEEEEYEGEEELARESAASESEFEPVAKEEDAGAQAQVAERQVVAKRAPAAPQPPRRQPPKHPDLAEAGGGHAVLAEGSRRRGGRGRGRSRRRPEAVAVTETPGQKEASRALEIEKRATALMKEIARDAGAGLMSEVEPEDTTTVASVPTAPVLAAEIAPPAVDQRTQPRRGRAGRGRRPKAHRDQPLPPAEQIELLAQRPPQDARQTQQRGRQTQQHGRQTQQRGKQTQQRGGQTQQGDRQVAPQDSRRVRRPASSALQAPPAAQPSKPAPEEPPVAPPSIAQAAKGADAQGAAQAAGQSRAAKRRERRRRAALRKAMATQRGASPETPVMAAPQPEAAPPPPVPVVSSQERQEAATGEKDSRGVRRRRPRRRRRPPNKPGGQTGNPSGDGGGPVAA